MTPWTRNRQRERFARAADALPGSPADSPAARPGRKGSSGATDAEPHDPRLAGELAVVRRLRLGEPATAPDDAARARMRATVLAGLPQVLAEQAAAATSSTSTTLSTRRTGTRRTGTRGRLAIAVGAAFCLVLALCGMTMLLSNSALPGDPLYGLRRTVESAAMGLTFGDESKGLRHLAFAADRVDDIDSLAARYPDLADSPAGDYLTALADFDSDAAAGSTDLTGYASSNGPKVLDRLSDWAQTQANRLRAVEPKLPVPARSGVTTSLDLLARIETRASELLARTSCYTVTSGATDDIGVLPATGPCDHAPTAVPVSTSPAAGAPGNPATSAAPLAPATSSQGEPASTSLRRVPPPARPPSSPAVTPPVLPPTRPSVPSNPILPPPTLSVPLPLPIGSIPPLLPGLPWLRVGG